MDGSGTRCKGDNPYETHDDHDGIAYTVAGLVDVCVDPRFPVPEAFCLPRAAQRTGKEGEEESKKPRLIVVREPCARPDVRHLDVGQGRFVAAGSVIDWAERVSLERPDEETILVRSLRPNPHWMLCALQALLVECGGTLLHAAGVCGPTGTYVFAGASGAGKTALWLDFLSEEGYRLLGDDLLVLTQGFVAAYDKDVVLHAGHADAALAKTVHAKRRLQQPAPRLAAFAKRMLRGMPHAYRWFKNHRPDQQAVRAADLMGLERLAARAFGRSVYPASYGGRDGGSADGGARASRG